jgi:hypothetical protein
MASKITQEVVNQVLAGFSPDDLLKIANEKQMETVKGDIELFLKTDSEQTERMGVRTTYFVQNKLFRPPFEPHSTPIPPFD